MSIRRDPTDGLRVCAKCREAKDRSQFGVNARSRDGLGSYCRACHQTYNKGRNRVGYVPDRAKAEAKAEVARIRKNARALNSALIKARRAVSYVKRPVQPWHGRRQRFKWTTYGRKVARPAALKRDQYQCQIGMAGCTHTATVVDHIVPLSRGGTDDLSNLQAACRRCNGRKGAT